MHPKRKEVIQGNWNLESRFSLKEIQGIIVKLIDNNNLKSKKWLKGVKIIEFEKEKIEVRFC